MSAELSHSVPVAPPDRSAPTSIEALDAAICSLARQMNAETYRMLVLVQEFNERCGFEKWGFRSCAEWLAWRCDLTLSAAREKVRTAIALSEMPLIAEAFAAGRLSYSKVRALTRVVEYHDEAALRDYALGATAVQVEERCREIRNGKPESVRDAWQAWQRRSLVIRRDAARGVMTISVEIPLADGEVVAKALERATRTGEGARGLEFAGETMPPRICDSERPRSTGNGWLAQQADALVAVARTYLAGGASGKAISGADHYQVVVHVDESALRGGGGRADLPIDTVQRLACDCSRVTVIDDTHGNPLDVGRKQRTLSTALRRALWARDRGCRFPGCRNRLYVDGHHILHWVNGGESTPDNTLLLCTHHHTLVHEGGFKVLKGQDGSVHFERPDGRVIPQCGYGREDAVDGVIGDDRGEPSAEVRDDEVREEPPVYQLQRRPRLRRAAV